MVSGASGVARSQKAQSWKGPNTIGTRERAWQKRQKTRRDMQRRTRRSASTIGGAAPDSIIGRAAARGSASSERVPANRRTKQDGAEHLPAAHITIISVPPIFRLKAKLYHPPSLQTPTMLCERRPLDSRTHPSFRCLHHRDSGLHNENSTLL
jgi:hypothetical protein